MDSSYCLSVEIGVICGKFRRMPGAADQTQNLYAELLEAGYKRPNTLLTPRQICIVIRHWGMPDTVYKWLREHPADRVQKLFADRKFD